MNKEKFDYTKHTGFELPVWDIINIELNKESKKEKHKKWKI